MVAGFRGERVTKHQLLNPRVWHCVHLAVGWWGWWGWVYVFCLVLFLLAMCHFGGGETFNNAPSRSSRSVSHSSKPHGTAAALSLGLEPLPPYTRGETLSSRTWGPGLPERWQGHAACLRMEPYVKPDTQTSGHFLLWDSQLRGLVTHDELSNVEIAAAIPALWTIS